VFAQDLAQDLPQSEIALNYVAAAVREFDSTVTEERCRTVMGSLGLVGEKSVRKIGALSGGEKARVALATFCLTPCNVLLLDEPTNHLDVDAIAALLDAIETYEGALVIVSHDRAFCDALRATHVGYVSDGSCVVEERELRDSDFSEADRGVRNGAVVEEADRASAHEEAVLSPEEAKAFREAERGAQKLRNAAPKKIAKLEGLIAETEAAMEALDAEMLRKGSDVGKLVELDSARGALQRKIDAWYLDWEELEVTLAD
jgi:ABC-type multidrug transport system ATPase subunit